MLGVLWLHVIAIGVVDCSGNYDSYFPSMTRFEAVMHGFVSCSVNCFALVSGYLLCRASFTSRRFLQLYAEILFYAVVIGAIWLFVFPGDLVRTLVSIPLSLTNYWYVNAYFGVLVFMPLLNRAIGLWADNVRGCAILLCVLILAQFLGNDGLGLNHGYSALWLSALYCLGGVVRHHEDVILKWGRWPLIGFVIVALAIGGIVCAGRAFPAWFHTNGVVWNAINTYDSPLLVATGLLAFLSFVNSKPLKIFSFFGRHAFAVYIIHMNALICRDMLKGSCGFVRDFGAISWIVEIVIVIAAYVACIAMDCIREAVFKMLRIDDCLDSVGHAVDKFLAENTVISGRGPV